MLRSGNLTISRVNFIGKFVLFETIREYYMRVDFQTIVENSYQCHCGRGQYVSTTGK